MPKRSRDADLVIVSVPVGASEAVAREIGSHLKPGAIVTDVGSTKASVVRQMAAAHSRMAHFIAGHPIAGTEQSGPRGRLCRIVRESLVHPDAAAGRTDAGCDRTAGVFWEACGSTVEEMDPDHHDRVLAIVSHLAAYHRLQHRRERRTIWKP
jgi:cyclohexadieny/prephenate dehydrogenase